MKPSSSSKLLEITTTKDKERKFISTEGPIGDGTPPMRILTMDFETTMADLNDKRSASNPWHEDNRVVAFGPFKYEKRKEVKSGIYATWLRAQRRIHERHFQEAFLGSEIRSGI